MSKIMRTLNIEHSTSNIEVSKLRVHRTFRRSVFDVGCWMFAFFLVISFVRAAEPIKALMITGGCCHDYEQQKKILSEGISARANVTWTIIHEGGGEAEAKKDT